MFPSRTSPEAAVPGPAGRPQQPHLLPQRSGSSLGHGEGHNFGGLARQTTPADQRGSRALGHLARNPWSKQGQLYPGERLSSPLSAFISSPYAAIRRPGVGVRCPDLSSGSAEAFLGGLGPSLRPRFLACFLLRVRLDDSPGPFWLSILASQPGGSRRALPLPQFPLLWVWAQGWAGKH